MTAHVHHPSFHARSTPDRPAVIMGGSGEVVTYAEMDEASNRFAQLLRARGLGVGDTVALCFDNDPALFGLAWGAQRAGVVYVVVSCRLAPPEVAYIVEDSGAKLLVSTQALAGIMDEVAKLAPAVPQLRLGGADAHDLAAALSAMPAHPVADERAGCDMLYSSGTTGKPKGVRKIGRAHV